jgi:hypothetical protein
VAVQYSEETLSRVKAWLSYSGSKRRTRENTAELHQLYAAISGGSATGCTNCNFSNYVAILTAYERQATHHFFPSTMADSSYALAPGYENETFVHEKFGEAITADNLTDKAAEFFIKNGFKHAFVKKEAAKADAGQPTLRKADYQARYKELLGTDADDKLTIAQLTEAIEAKEAELNKQD